MRTENVPGEFGFRVLINRGHGWTLHDKYFFTEEEVKAWIAQLNPMPPKVEYKWPVEMQDGGIIYIPDPSEMK